MATKTITVTEDAYNLIKGLKNKDESFSSLFKRLSKEKSISHKYLGILKRDPEKMRAEIRKLREEISKDFVKRENGLSVR